MPPSRSAGSGAVAFTLIELLVVLPLSPSSLRCSCPRWREPKRRLRLSAALTISNSWKPAGTCMPWIIRTYWPQITRSCTAAGTVLAAGLSWCPDHARTDTTNTDLKSGVLFPYNTSVAIYHCPADRSTVETASGQETTQLRNRSYNMSQSAQRLSEYVVLPTPTYTLPAWKKFSEIRNPVPNQLFVFIDEHPDILLDAQFGNPGGHARLRRGVVGYAGRPA